MCGIIGYIGSKEALPVLMKGLQTLEYRGYDSAGIACLDEENGKIHVEKEEGKLGALKEKIKSLHIAGSSGIGHTRWATHGAPSRKNAHPHQDYRKKIALVHNGIVENYAELKRELLEKGVPFLSETDTEVAANLIGYYLQTMPIEKAFPKALKRLKGYFSFVLLHAASPGRVYVFRRSNPLCIGLGRGENFVASDVTPLLAYTDKIIYLDDDDYAWVSRDEASVFSLKTGKAVKRSPVTIRWSVAQAAKEGYPHFMLKEIHEQPEVMKQMLRKRVLQKQKIYFDSLDEKAVKRLVKIRKVFLVSCGTAYHAGLVGGILLENFARLPSYAQVSSEFRYSDPVVGREDLVVLITQSGETADTLAALREAKAKGAMTLAIVNVVGSTIAREADTVIYTHAGPEIGVASTKAYTAQLMTLTLLSLLLGECRGVLRVKEMSRLLKGLNRIPELSRKVIKQYKKIDLCAKKLYQHRSFLFLGRGYNFPSALEGALKLKEISYAHAHGYAAGEMKHGPIALIDNNQPVICVAPFSKTYDKMLSNIEEIRARSGIVIAIGSEGDKELPKKSRFFFSVPVTEECYTPVLTAIILQIFAYRIAVHNERDVDQPRNLAKSVTVE